jgi:hypothetical protein
LYDTPNAFSIDRTALLRAVKIDEMQKPGSLIRPLLGHRGRVAAENSFLGVVPLLQTYALAAANIDGWENEHDVFPLPLGKMEV